MQKPIIFLGGRSATGKTAALRNLKNPEKALYLNFEAKDVPFRANWKEKRVTDPYTLHSVSQRLIADGTKKFDTLIVDSITACMALFATKYIGKDCPNKMVAWGDYGSFYETWAKQMLPEIPQQVIVIAHVDDYEDKSTMESYSQAVVQGRLKGIGLEADFGSIFGTTVVKTEDLKEFNNPYLNITEDEELEGFKHVIQTRRTEETKHTKIRSSMGMWAKSETYIDSDVQILLDRYNEFYN